MSAPVIVDRADIHKSCKALEGIIAVLMSYAEAADALAAVQKKLAKALKDAATVKGTNHVPSNALLNSASVFDNLADVGAKFAKIADKEAEGVGNELRKWFKKLVKEEKAHDDRIINANAKIKQAGQTYEKKAKRREREAADEHARYLAILNSVGPEMSQDKHNHALMVTQRHTLTLSGCAAALSRLAEAEWARVCEAVRRAAPTVGAVGEWRALCEASWTAPIPPDLPDLSAAAPEQDRDKKNGGGNDVPAPTPATAIDKTQDAPRTLLMPPAPPSVAPSNNSTTNHEHPSDSPTSPLQPSSHAVASPSFARSSETNSSVAAPDHSQHSHSRPPTPLPERKKSADVALPGGSLLQQSSDALDKSTTHTSVADPPPLSTSPTELQSAGADPRAIDDAGGTLRSAPHQSQEHPARGTRAQPRGIESFTSDRERDTVAAAVKISPVSPRAIRPVAVAALERRGSIESTTSNGSLVAAMRDRYDPRSPTTPSSPPPRDLPRLPRSVPDLATQYTPIVPNASYRGLAADRFPTFQDRYPRPIYDKERDRDRDIDRDRDRGRDRDRERDRDQQERYRSPPAGDPALLPPAQERDFFPEREPRYHHAATAPSSSDRNRFLRDDRERYRPPPSSPPPEDAYYTNEFGVRDRTPLPPPPPRPPSQQQQQQQRRLVLDAAEERAILQQREEQLRERELELERERARLTASVRGMVEYNNVGSSSSNSVRGRSPLAQREYASPERRPRGDSFSPGRPPSAAVAASSSLLSLSQSLRPPSPPLPPQDHAPNCGCHRCSARHYAAGSVASASAATATVQVQQPRPEKPAKTSWLRRMSMPLVSTPQPATTQSRRGGGGGTGAANIAVPEGDGRVRRRSFEMGRMEEEEEEEAASRYATTRR